MSGRRLATFSILLPILSNVGSCTSTPADYSPSTSNSTYPGYIHPSNGVCIDVALKLPVTYPSQAWTYPHFEDNWDVAASIWNMTSKTAATDFKPFAEEVANISKTFEVAGTFCKPLNETSKRSSTALVLTHGGGFDRRYWASSYKPEDYSFVKSALDEGYSVFYYDRLGIGLSQRVPGYENRASISAALLTEIVRSLRAGKVPGASKADKVVLVGHSYGSFLSNSVISQHPELVDAAVLTGMAYPKDDDPALTIRAVASAIFAWRIAATAPPPYRPQFADTFDNAYLTFADIYTFATSFFHQPDYDVDAAKYAFSIGQPLGMPEFVSTFALDLKSPNFKGKLLLTSGARDLLVCGGDCASTYETGLQNSTFPKAEVATYAHPGAGHGVNFGFNATGFYDTILQFVGGV